MLEHLDILLLSDTRASWQFIDQLVEFELDTMNRSYDFVLLAGGTGNSQNGVHLTMIAEAEKQSKEDHEATMDKLEKLLKKDADKGKVIFVPGLTDAQSLFKEDEKADKSAKSINLHKDIYELGTGLYVAGLGGSVPAYYTSYESMEKETEGVYQMPSYPYADDEALQDALDDLWFHKVQELQKKEEEFQVLVLSYEGPTDYATTHGHDDYGFYQNGSEVLSTFLHEITGMCIGAVHGHSHLGAFEDHMRHNSYVNYPIVNPGALSLGEYGYMNLIHETHDDHKHWRVAESSKRFLSLDAVKDLYPEHDADFSESDKEDEVDEQKRNFKDLKSQMINQGQPHTGGQPTHHQHGVNQDALHDLIHNSHEESDF